MPDYISSIQPGDLSPGQHLLGSGRLSHLSQISAYDDLVAAIVGAAVGAAVGGGGGFKKPLKKLLK